MMRFRAFMFASALALLCTGLIGATAAHDGTDHRKPAATSAGAAPIALDRLFGGPFALVDQDGNLRTDGDFRGGYLLIYFGYTDCPAICPLNLVHIFEALDLLGADGTQVQPVFVSVDPAKDTPARLRAFVNDFDPRLTGLTGSPQQVSAALKAYRVHRRKLTQQDTDPADYLVDHSSITHLIGPDGRHLTLFPHNTPGATIAARLRSYLRPVSQPANADGL